MKIGTQIGYLFSAKRTRTVITTTGVYIVTTVGTTVTTTGVTTIPTTLMVTTEKKTGTTDNSNG